MFNQNAPIPQTVLFVPTEAGRYRFAAYISAKGDPQRADWYLEFLWTDVTGISQAVAISADLSARNVSVQSIGAYAFTAQSGTPVSFTVGESTNAPVDTRYNFWFTIEQLVE
jgi:hypothetical protein